MAVDITERMLQLARNQGVEEAACADATLLPFADASFDAVFIGYGLRNFPDLKKAVREIERVTKPGGMMVSLDFFLPQNRVFREMYLGYLYVQGAAWGIMLHGRPRILYIHSGFDSKFHHNARLQFPAAADGICERERARVYSGRHRAALGCEAVGREVPSCL